MLIFYCFSCFLNTRCYFFLDTEISVLNSSLFDSLDRIDISDLDNFVFRSSPSSSPPVLQRATGKNIRLSTCERQDLLSMLGRPTSSGHSSIPTGASSLPRPSGKNFRLSARERQDLLSAVGPRAPAHPSTIPSSASSPPSGTRNAPRLSLRSNHGHLTRRNRRTGWTARTRSTRQKRRRNQLASIALRAVCLVAELVQLII
ncbi:uncharacterized protein LOC112842460 [Oreochromis niloticus]|uniref:uncharacterized protein LOC112842460 n=1 Tax=Oreochromis niloticus TaxID=8128 RepID=UPI000DF1F4D4|nr:uncharacterized protein LOC112842460 [Oreochromis niloticus]